MMAIYETIAILVGGFFIVYMTVLDVRRLNTVTGQDSKLQVVVL